MATDKKKKFPETVYVFFEHNDYSDDLLVVEPDLKDITFEHGDLIAVYELREIKRAQVKTTLVSMPRRKRSSDEIVKEARESLGL